MSLRVFTSSSNQILTEDQVAAICRLRGLEYNPKGARAKSSPKPESSIIAPTAKASPKQNTKHPITIEGPVSVVDLAAMLGLQKRDVIIEAQRIGIPVTSATRLGLFAVERIAAVFGFPVLTK